ncbi:MAG: hypothetical protein MN733_19820, partial [Nitrososphaera sp.]|nr:hypothetical protein [Nitrososphaera sp.]
HRRVGILAEHERGAGVVHEDMAKPLPDPGSRHDALHLGGKLDATPALGGADNSLLCDHGYPRSSSNSAWMRPVCNPRQLKINPRSSVFKASCLASFRIA